MTDIWLPALEGTNPLGFLAALGVLDSLAGVMPDVTLRWSDELVPCAVIGGVSDVDGLLDVLDNDREAWESSPLLAFQVDGRPLSDAKPDQEQLRRWFEFVSGPEGSLVATDHLCAIVAEDALDGKLHAKPTHLHFTAGQQQWLKMIRELMAGVDRGRLQEAICGPWRYDSSLPSLSWDSRGERVYAVRAVNPSNETRLGVPGADWLAFRGLVFYPVMRTERGALRTTACNDAWKASAFRWPLWKKPISRNVARSLVADSGLVTRGATARPADLAARGIISVRQSRVRRTDQGGYGSFGASETLASVG